LNKITIEITLFTGKMIDLPIALAAGKVLQKARLTGQLQAGHEYAEHKEDESHTTTQV